MLMMLSKHFTFDHQHQIKRNHTTFDDSSLAKQEVDQIVTDQIMMASFSYFH